MAAEGKRVDHDDVSKRSKQAHYMDGAKPVEKKIAALKAKKDEAAVLKDRILQMEKDLDSDHVGPFLKDENEQQGKTLRSVYIKYSVDEDGKGIYALVSYKDTFKIVHPESLPELKKFLKKKFEKYFPMKSVIKLKKGAEKELFDKLGKDAKKFLVKSDEQGVVSNFSQAVSFAEDKEKEKIEEVVEQVRPSFRFD